MLASFDIAAAALLGVCIVMLFERRWCPPLVVTPLVGLVHGAAILCGTFMPPVSDQDGVLQHAVRGLDDPFLLVAATVASATGSVAAAFMLKYARASTARPGRLMDVNERRTSGSRRRQAATLEERIRRLPDGATRTLVERGYDVDSLSSVFTIEEPLPPPPSPTPVAPRAAQPVPVHNLRKAPRRRTILAGRLCWDGVRAECVIQNLSITGAAIRLRGAPLIPKLVTLINVTNGLAHHAEISWRFGDNLGLKFLASWDLSAPSTPETRAMAAYWHSLREPA